MTENSLKYTCVLNGVCAASGSSLSPLVSCLGEVVINTRIITENSFNYACALWCTCASPHHLSPLVRFLKEVGKWSKIVTEKSLEHAYALNGVYAVLGYSLSPPARFQSEVVKKSRIVTKKRLNFAYALNVVCIYAASVYTTSFLCCIFETSGKENLHYLQNTRKKRFRLRVCCECWICRVSLHPTPPLNVSLSSGQGNYTSHHDDLPKDVNFDYASKGRSVHHPSLPVFLSQVVNKTRTTT